MHEPDTAQLEGSPTAPSLAPQAAGVAPAPDCRSARRQRRRCQSVDEARPRGGTRRPAAPSARWGPSPALGRAAHPLARALRAGPRSLWLSGSALDAQADCRSDSARLRDCLSPPSCRPPLPGHPVEPAKACPASPPARRGGDCPVARGDLSRHQKRAEAQQQTLLFLDESGFYPLPSVVRTYAPVGQTPILREWCTRDHLSAISAISPEGKLYFHCQDSTLNSADVIAFLEHLLREVPGRMVLIWDGSPIHRSQHLREFLANGASSRLHLERLPAYAPELNPGEGLWQQLKGVELRNLCCVDIPHLRGELRDAVKRVRRKPHLIKSFFRGANL